MEKYYLTRLDNDTYLIEKPFSHDQQDFISLYAYNKPNNKIEQIGITYSEMEYYYNSKYVILATEDEIEIVFDIKKFDFITDDKGKRKAFTKMMNGSMLDMLEHERREIRLGEEEKVIMALRKKIEIPN